MSTTATGIATTHTLLVPENKADFFSLNIVGQYSISVHYKLLLTYITQQKKASRHSSIANGLDVLEKCILQGLRKMDYELLEAAAETQFGFWYKTVRGITLKERCYSIGFRTATIVEMFLAAKQLMICKNDDQRFFTEVQQMHLKEQSSLYSVLFIEGVEINRNVLKMYSV